MKFLYGYFDQKTGKSQVALADKYGTYIGYAYLHPDDKDNASKFMGCRLAEQRAWIKGLQTRRRIIKIKIQTVNEILEDIITNAFVMQDAARKRFYLKLKFYNNEIKEIDQQIKDIKDDIRKRIQIRDKIIKKK